MATSIPDAVKKFTELPGWQEGDEQKRHELVRGFALHTASTGLPEEHRGPMLESLYDAAGARGFWGTIGHAASEALKSVPAGGGALVGAVSDTVGITGGGSGQRVQEGFQDLGDSAAQRVKSLHPDDWQEFRDKALTDFKADMDRGAYPPGVIPYLSGQGGHSPEEQAAYKEGETWVNGWREVLLRASVLADKGDAAVKDEKLLATARTGQRGMWDSDKIPDLMADYMATRDPQSWSALATIAGETEVQWKQRFSKQKEQMRYENFDPQNSTLDDLSLRAADFQRSPIDMAMTAFPLMRGAKALQAARGGASMQAVRETTKSAAGEFASGAATEALSNSGRATTGEVLESGGMEALGGATVTAGAAATGAAIGGVGRLRNSNAGAPAEGAIAGANPAAGSNTLPGKPASPPAAGTDAAPAPPSPAGTGVQGEPATGSASLHATPGSGAVTRLPGLLDALLPEDTTSSTSAGEAEPLPYEESQNAPQQTPRVEPAPRAEDPAAPVAATPGTVTSPPVPDTVETVDEQARLAADKGSTRKAVLITPGTPKPTKTPGLSAVKTPHGLVLFNPKKTTRAEIVKAAEGETFDATVLGMSAAPAPAEPSTTVVTASLPGAPNVQAELAEPDQIPAAIAAASAAAPGATVEVKPLAQVVDERLAGATSAQPAAPPTAARSTAPGATAKAGQSRAGNGSVATPATAPRVVMSATNPPLSPSPLPSVSQKSATSALNILRANAPEIAQGVRLVGSAADLNPADYHPDDWRGIADGQSEGFYNPATGETIILADNIRQREGETAISAAARVILHERVGHAGLALLRQSDPDFAKAWATLTAEIPAEELAALIPDYPHLAELPDKLAEEWFARHGAEKANITPGSLVARMWAALKAAVAKLWRNFTGSKLTLNDRTAELVKASRRALAADRATAGTGEGESVMQSRIRQGEEPPPGMGVNQFGERLPDSDLRAEWRAQFEPGLYEKFGFEELKKRVGAWLGQQQGLEGALKFYEDPGNGLKPYEREALAQALAKGFDIRARRAFAAGDTAAGEAAETQMERVLESMEGAGTSAAQMLAARRMWYDLSPEAAARTAQRAGQKAREAEFDNDFPATNADAVRAQVQAARAADTAAEETDLADAATRTAVRWIERLAKSQSDTLSWRKPAVLSALEQMIRAHLKQANPDFSAQAQSLGLDARDADVLDSLIKEEHRRRDGIQREKALAALIAKLEADAPARVKGALPGFIRDIYRAAGAGVLTRGSFLDAYAKHYDKPRWTPAFAEEIRALAARVQAQPEGSWLRHREQNKLMARLSQWNGIPAGKLWTGYWYANILSGLGTQAVNLTGNAAHLALRTFQMLATQPQHFGAFLRGMLRGAVEGRREGWAAFRHGEPVMRADDQWQKEDVLEILWDAKNSDLSFWRKVVKYGAASWGRYIFRGLTAADSLFFNTAKEGRAWAELSRNGGDVAEAAGLDADSMAGHIRDAAAELKAAGHDSPPVRDIRRRAFERAEAAREAELSHTARQFGARTTYNYEPEGFFGLFHQAVTALQTYLATKDNRGAAVASGLLRAFVPFSRIVSNIADVSADWTPIGLARAAAGGHLVGSRGQKFTRQERMERLVAGATGTALMGTLYAMLAGSDDDDDTAPFMVYGSGPGDSGRRAQMPVGWKPRSMKIGGKYFSYESTPLAFAFGILGTALDQERYGNQRGQGQGWSRAGALLAAAPRTLMDSGVLSSLSQTFEMLDGKRKPGAWAERMAASFLPAASFMKDVATLMDPQKVDPAHFGATFLSYLPVVRGDQQPLLNVFGDPVKEPGPWLLSRIVRDVDRTDPQALWLMRNDLHIPWPDSEVAVGQWLEKSDKARLPAATLARIHEGYLTPDERTAFLRETGPAIRKAIAVLQTSPAPVKQSQVNAAVSKIRRRAMLNLVK